MIDVLGEVNAEVGEKLKGVNTKIDKLVQKEKAFKEVIKDKKEDDLTTEEKDMREDFSKKLGELRQEKQQVLRKEGEKNKLVGQMIDLALLSNGMLKGEGLTSFIRRSVELISK